LVFSLIAISLVAICLLQGCGSSVNSTSGFSGTGPATFTQAYSQVLGQANCVSCHQPGGSAMINNGVQLDFSTQTSAYNTLMNNFVTATDRTCANVRIVVPNNAPVSYLATVLFPSYYQQNDFVVAGCTPYSGHETTFSFSTSDVNVVIGWINAGAPNN